MRVLIIGAGPAGLATALALRRAGADPVVYERAPAAPAGGAALTLWPNAFAALAAFGAADAVRAVGVSAEAMTMCASSGRVLYELPEALLAERYGTGGVAMRRAALTAALLDLLGPGTIRYGARCVAVREEGPGASGRVPGGGSGGRSGGASGGGSGGGSGGASGGASGDGSGGASGAVVAEFADGSRVRGDVLIGADGMRSAVRVAAGLGGRLRYAGYPVWRGVAELPLDRGYGLLSLGRGAQFGLWRLPAGQAYWFASITAAEGTGPAGAAGLRLLADRFAGWHRPIPEVIAATEPHRLIVTDIYDCAPLRHWSRGRVILVGDAAHPSPPNLGQGTCQAFEDAAVLADCLSGVIARGARHPGAGGYEPDLAEEIAAAARAYERRRRGRANAITAQARWMGRLGRLRGPVVTRLLEGMLARMPARAQLAQLDRVFAASPAGGAGKQVARSRGGRTQTSMADGTTRPPADDEDRR